MTEAAFTKPTNDSPFIRNDPVNYTTGILTPHNKFLTLKTL